MLCYCAQIIATRPSRLPQTGNNFHKMKVKFINFKPQLLQGFQLTSAIRISSISCNISFGSFQVFFHWFVIIGQSLHFSLRLLASKHNASFTCKVNWSCDNVTSFNDTFLLQLSGEHLHPGAHESPQAKQPLPKGSEGGKPVFITQLLIQKQLFIDKY